MGVETKKQQKRQHEYDVDMFERESQFNAEQAQIAYDRQREFYDYQFGIESEYNSPLSQMQRYKAAGLNPYLMDFSDGSTNVSASSPSSASASGHNTVNGAAYQSNQLQALNNIVQFANAFRELDSQISLNESAVAKNIAEANKVAGVDSDKSRAEIKNILSDTKNKDADTIKKIAETDLTEKQKDKVIQETENLSYTLKHLLPKQSKEILARIEQITNDIKNSQQLTRAQCAEMFQNIKESVSRVELNNRESDLLYKQYNVFDEKFAADLNLSREQFQQLKLGNIRTEMLNQFTDEFMSAKPINNIVPSYLKSHIPKFAQENADQAERYFKLLQLQTLQKLNLNF